jgi:hypothetical protein
VQCVCVICVRPPLTERWRGAGGTGSWRTTFPTCGCQRSASPPFEHVVADRSLTPAGSSSKQQTQVNSNYTAERGYMGLTRLLPQPPGASAINYTGAQGFLPDGNDISHTNLTWAEGIAQCSARSDCTGITFKSTSSKPSKRVPLYLKKCGGVERAAGWWSWSRPRTGPGAMPAPKMPAACALFCATGESCDACHPDNDGYDALSMQVFNWISAHYVPALPRSPVKL